MSVYGDEDGPTSIVPRVQNLSELRACRICGLVKSLDQFVQDGCDNCEYRDRQAVEYTTNQFKGLIAMMNPEQSWIHKWQRMKREYKPGCYAVTVEGRTAAEDIDRDTD